MATMWLEYAAEAFGTKPAAPAALFSREEAAGLDGALFTAAGDPVPDAVPDAVPGAVPGAVPLAAAERADLEAERGRLLARLSEIDGILKS